MSDLQTVLFTSSWKFKPLTFFNPRISMFTAEVSTTTGMCQVKMVRALDPDRKGGKVQAGEKIYDHDNPVFFSLSSIECSQITRLMNDILKGTYINPDAKDDKYKNTFMITHFKDNAPSRFVIERAKDVKGNATGTIRVTIVPTKGEGNPCSYSMRLDEMIVFNNFVKHCAIDLPYSISIIAGVLKTLKSVNFELDSKGEGGDKKYNGGGYNKGGYKKKEEVDTIDEPVSAPSGGDTGDGDFGYGDDSGSGSSEEDFGF